MWYRYKDLSLCFRNLIFLQGTQMIQIPMKSSSCFVACLSVLGSLGFCFVLFFKLFYCCSITVVCISPPRLPPTPVKPTSVPCFHLPPLFCLCVLYNSSWKPFPSLSSPPSPPNIVRLFLISMSPVIFCCFFLLLWVSGFIGKTTLVWPPRPLLLNFTADQEFFFWHRPSMLPLHSSEKHMSPCRFIQRPWVLDSHSAGHRGPMVMWTLFYVLEGKLRQMQDLPGWRKALPLWKLSEVLSWELSPPTCGH